MTTQELKQQAREEFDKLYRDINTPSGLNQTDYYSVPDLINNIRESFIDFIIDRTIQHEQERIVDMIHKLEIHHFSGMDKVVDGDDLVKLDEVIDIITNTKQ